MDWHVVEGNEGEDDSRIAWTWEVRDLRIRGGFPGSTAYLSGWARRRRCSLPFQFAEEIPPA